MRYALSIAATLFAATSVAQAQAPSPRAGRATMHQYQPPPIAIVPGQDTLSLEGSVGPADAYCREEVVHLLSLTQQRTVWVACMRAKLRQLGHRLIVLDDERDVGAEYGITPSTRRPDFTIRIPQPWPRPETAPAVAVQPR